MRAAWLVALAAVTGCGTDPCKDVSGTCVSLTVESSTVSAIDGLHLVASGAVTGPQDSRSTRSTLPVHVAVKLPADASGPLHLDVQGLVGDAVVGQGATDTTVVPGKHTSATATLTAAGNPGGGDDLATDDMTGAPPADMNTTPCDPKGVTGPQCQWRWQTPLPQGDSIYGVVAIADNDIYAVTRNGLVMHRDATAWSVLPVQPMTPTGDAWSPGPMFGDAVDVFIGGADKAGAPIVFHSGDHGQSWTFETLPAGLSGQVSAGASSGGVAVATFGTPKVLVRQSGTWSAVDTGATAGWSGVAVEGALWVLVGSGTATASAFTSNPTMWTQFPSANVPNVPINGICGAPGGVFWAVGGNGTTTGIIRWDGNTTTHNWVAQTSPIGNANLTGCAAADGQHAWAWGASAGALIYTTDGSMWMGVPTPPAGNPAYLAGSHSPQSTLILGATGHLFRSTNGGVSFVDDLQGLQDPLVDVFGVAPGVLYAAGKGGVIDTTTDDGVHWQHVMSSGTTGDLTAVWGKTPTDVFAVGTGTVVHSSDGATFTKYAGGTIPATAALVDVYGSARGVYTVGSTMGTSSQAVVYRSTDDGASWAALTLAGLTDQTMSFASGVFATDTDVWVTGFHNGTALVYHSSDGAAFSAQTLPTIPGGGAPGRVRGGGGGVLFSPMTTGTAGQILWSKNGGATWTLTSGVFVNYPSAIAVTPTGNEAYVLVGGDAPAFTLDTGTTWKPWGVPADPFYTMGVFAFGANDVFVVGTHGILRYGN